jgi:hypothetical protein
MKKKTVILMMLAALCVGMTACGGKNVSDSTEVDTVTIEDEETPQAEDTESATEESEGEVTYVEGTKEDFNLQELDNNELAITKYLGDAEYLIIPDNISGREIVEVSGFNSKDNLKGVVIPDTVKTIDELAFNGCSNLESVTLGNNVETIGERAFTNCDALETVNFPDSLKSIGEGAFSGTSLNKIEISTSVTVIEKGTFACNDGITEIVIPNNIKSIGRYAFEDDHELIKVTIEDGVEEIGNGAFDECRQLEELHIPASVTTFVDDFIVDSTDILTIYAPAGSAAEEYAHSHDINFVEE